MTKTFSSKWIWLLPMIILAGWGIQKNLSRLSVDKELSPDLPVYGKIPEFRLTKQNGEAMALSDLSEKVWIADFIFTHCAGPCPLISGRMSQLQQRLKEEDRVRLVSFSVDPERDTPSVLTEYAEKFKADPDRWIFLTGDKQTIFDLSERHFHLGVGDVPAGERETPDQTVRHSTVLVLVDGEARIRGYYDSEEEMSVSKLVKDAKILLNQSPREFGR